MMEETIVAPAKCEIRTVIRFLNFRRISPIEIHWQLTSTYGLNVKGNKKGHKKREEVVHGIFGGPHRCATPAHEESIHL